MFNVCNESYLLTSTRSIADHRAAKKLAAHNGRIDLARAESMLVPSSMPEQRVPTSETQTNNVPIAELEGTSAELSDSSMDSPPAYTAEREMGPVEKE